ncbi:MAG TPA: hypothetical protein VJT13_05565 [Xanthobacteraceae bacterium]|nr:hypothetical protein [Xanthobacteraceae bacterium]
MDETRQSLAAHASSADPPPLPCLLREIVDLGWRLGIKLTAIKPKAVLVVTRDKCDLSAIEVKSHQRGMRGVGEGIDDESTFECAGCAGVVAAARQNPTKARERIDTQRGKPPALQVEPLLKRRFAQRQSVEQCSAIERRCALQLGRLVTLRRAKKLEHIDIELCGRKTDNVPVGDDCVFPERGPQRAHRLAQTVPRVSLRAIAPEQIQYPVTRHAAARR